MGLTLSREQRQRIRWFARRRFFYAQQGDELSASAVTAVFRRWITGPGGLEQASEEELSYYDKYSADLEEYKEYIRVEV